MWTYLLIAIGGLIALLLLVAAMQPAVKRVERQMLIAATPEQIFPLLDSPREAARWSPYHRKDPAMKTVYSGPEHGVGAKLEFDGNKDVGAGRITVVDSTPPNEVRLRLEMWKPMKGDNVITYALTPRPDGTVVGWAMEFKAPLFVRAICLFMNMDRMIGADFERGLQNLRELVAQQGARSA